MILLDTVATLTSLVGPPGHEDDVRDTLRALVTPLVDEVRTDACGNLLAVRRGACDNRLLLDAHMDEVGFMVTHVDANGFLLFGPLGGWDARVVPNSRVLLRVGPGQYLPGVIGALPPHVTRAADRDAAIPLESLSIDIGARSTDEVTALGVAVGTTLVLDAGFGHLAGRRIHGRAFDDRVACAALLSALEQLQQETLPWTLVACFSTGEERGMIGAAAASRAIAPHLALCLETTTATDVPGVGEAEIVARMGQGVALTLADRVSIVPSWYSESLRALCESNGIACQWKRPLVGGTNAPHIERALHGVPTAIASVPARNIHSAVSVIDQADAEAMTALVVEVVRAADQLQPQ